MEQQNVTRKEVEKCTVRIWAMFYTEWDRPCIVSEITKQLDKKKKSFQTALILYYITLQCFCKIFHRFVQEKNIFKAQDDCIN